MAAELTLAESLGAGTRVASAGGTVDSSELSATKPTAASPNGVRQNLAKVTSLKFARDTLESALEQLSQDIGIPIAIRGSDLQADGITKNQSFGIDVANQPAEQILI
jgi:hypothetical protein